MPIFTDVCNYIYECVCLSTPTLWPVQLSDNGHLGISSLSLEDRGDQTEAVSDTKKQFYLLSRRLDGILLYIQSIF